METKRKILEIPLADVFIEEEKPAYATITKTDRWFMTTPTPLNIRLPARENAGARKRVE
jgi:hypothetical protein